MSNNMFNVVGITVHEGNDAKVRFTDDLVRRVKQFAKGGATRCDFIELPNEMTKLDALTFMLSHPNFQSAADQATINDTIIDKEKAARRSGTRVTVKPSLDAIRSRAKKPVAATVEDVLAVVVE